MARGDPHTHVLLAYIENIPFVPRDLYPFRTWLLRLLGAGVTAQAVLGIKRSSGRMTKWMKLGHPVRCPMPGPPGGMRRRTGHGKVGVGSPTMGAVPGTQAGVIGAGAGAQSDMMKAGPSGGRNQRSEEIGRTCGLPIARQPWSVKSKQIYCRLLFIVYVFAAQATKVNDTSTSGRARIPAVCDQSINSMYRFRPCLQLFCRPATLRSPRLARATYVVRLHKTCLATCLHGQDVADIAPEVAKACLAEDTPQTHAFKQKLLAAEKRELAMAKTKPKNKTKEATTTAEPEKPRNDEKKAPEKKKKKKEPVTEPKTEYMKRKKSFLSKKLGSNIGSVRSAYSTHVNFCARGTQGNLRI